MAELKLEISASRQFTSWLQEHRLSLAFSTYLTGKVFFIGSTSDGKMTVFNRNFSRVMGLCSPRPGTIWMTTLFQIWRLENALARGQRYQKEYDAMFVPQAAYTSGDVDAHDIAVDGSGSPIFVNTLFSCLARPSATHSFEPIWKPSFVSRLAAEDRCHLNGLAMEEGQPRYVTAAGATDVHGGWRDHRPDGGVLIDVLKDEILTEGLSMPHSPRIHRGELYILDSGSGYFGRINRMSGEFERIAFTPGYARGMTFYGDFAIMGLSLCRENRTFSGLALDGELEAKKVEARCGIQVVDLRTGDTVHSLELLGDVRELYDVVALPGVLAPAAIGFQTDEIRRTITMVPGKGSLASIAVEVPSPGVPVGKEAPGADEGAGS